MISNISCQTCLFSFDSINYLFTHLEELSACNLHKDASYNCPICTFKCNGSNDFCRHLSQDHLIDPLQYSVNNTADASAKGKFKCTYCEKVFRKPSDLTRHLRIHTNEKPFKCHECGRSFKLKSTLNGHERTHKSVSNDEIYVCIFCNHNFLSFSALKLHMRIHTNETPFPCDFPGCKQNFRTKKLMHTHFRNFHENEKNLSTTLLNDHISSAHLLAPCPKVGVLNTIGGISQLEGQPLITSRNTAFTQFQKHNDYNEEVILNVRSSKVVVIRVQVRSGSVVPGSSVGQIPTDIILETSRLINLSQHGLFMCVALKKTGLPLNLALSIDPRSVLNRLEPPTSNIFPHNTLSDHCRTFTSVVYPTVQHVISNPPLPFSVLCTAEDDLRKIRCHMPSFLIECFLATSDTNQYDVEHRQVLAQSCLPMLCNENGVQYDEFEKNQHPY